MDLSKVLERPIITEKSTQGVALGKYAFKVAKKANKKEVAKAIEQFFDVHVRQVQTVIIKGKKKRARSRKEFKQPDWKKAIVQLAEGEKIDIFETGE